MGEFQRSPSKVWWANEEGAVSWRSASASPGSQDSGFSDTETSPNLQGVDLLKNVKKHGDNLMGNVVEKDTPKKSLIVGKSATVRKIETTPVRRPVNQSQSEPSGRYQKNAKGQHLRVSRNLFRVQAESTMEPNQNARGDSISSEVTSSSNASWSSSDSVLPSSVKTLPLVTINYPAVKDLSAPAILQKGGDTPTSSLNRSYTSSDCDSELECLFKGLIESPKHTSTPVASTRKKQHEQGDLHRMHAVNLLQKYRNERVPPLSVDTEEEGTALAKWIDGLKNTYESECVITLQCKSIAGDLADKVTKLAAIKTHNLVQLIHYNNLIEKEFDNLKNQKKHKRPLIQNLADLILEYLRKNKISTDISKTCEQLKFKETPEDDKTTAQLHINWNILHKQLLTIEIKRIVEGLEAPNNELDVRAKLTGLTSIALRNEPLIEMFISAGAVQVVTTLSEKCEGSSVRGLALRALSTLCVNAAAIRKFEVAEGVQMLADCLTDEHRPEPERTEATALLAQITAPWIEDNHCVQGLHKQSRKLAKCLTRMLQLTRCCQAALLCTAALANLTAMDQKSIKYLIQNDTMHTLLTAVKKHGARASIYLLEQVATLITNMSATPEARRSLTRDEAPVALICFLQTRSMDDEVIKRLQQKSVIGLSRLCSEVDAARQVVNIGGVDRLVKLCREKKERFDSDAILVAALATLRKIAEACGVQVVNEEDAQELIQPRLLDSFMAYSTQSESLV